MKLAKNLKGLRKDQHLTQNGLANRLHVSRKTVSNWENGRSQPSFQILMTLSKIYGVSTDIMLYGKNEKGSRKVTIAYYLNIILFIFSYMIDDRSLGLRACIWILLIVNLCYLIINYKQWIHTIKSKKAMIIIIIISLIYSFLDSFIYIHIRPISLTQYNNKPYFDGSLIGIIGHVLIMTIAFFMILLLSKNLRLLFGKHYK